MSNEPIPQTPEQILEYHREVARLATERADLFSKQLDVWRKFASQVWQWSDELLRISDQMEVKESVHSMRADYQSTMVRAEEIRKEGEK